MLSLVPNHIGLETRVLDSHSLHIEQDNPSIFIKVILIILSRQHIVVRNT